MPRIVAWLVLLAIAPVAVADWAPSQNVEGIAVQHRSVAGSNVDEFRAAVKLCAGPDGDGIEDYVRDIGHFKEWLPGTRAAWLIERSADTQVHYIRTRTIWPFSDRDQVYRLTRMPGNDPEIVAIRIEGLPDRIPPESGAVRMTAASGEWDLRSHGDAVEVSFRLHVEPGAVPALIANHIVADTVGETLVNLRRRFPCP